MTEAFCVKCRKKVTIKDGKNMTLKNGRKAIKGKCSTCSTNVFRIVSGK